MEESHILVLKAREIAENRNQNHSPHEYNAYDLPMLYLIEGVSIDLHLRTFVYGTHVVLKTILCFGRISAPHYHNCLSNILEEFHGKHTSVKRQPLHA